MNDARAIVPDLTLLQRIRSFLIRPVQATADDSLLLLGRMASWKVRSLTSIPSLDAAEFKVYSQWGEDGIIDWLIERAQIPGSVQSFIEFGVESYAEANTRFLLKNRNWRGLVIDGSQKQIEALKKEMKLFWAHDLTAKAAFITRENVNEEFESAGFSGEIGLLSIDIDGNDYWVWEAISAIRPIICVCEYNAVFGDIWPITIPYDPQFSRSRTEFKNLYFGASIGALRSLAKRKGYRFLGTNSAGVNAFFVREDYASRFDSCLGGARAYPSRLRESMDEPGRLSYVRGVRRYELIRELPVVNTETDQRQSLGSLKPLYSEDWLRVLEPKPAELEFLRE
jgi:hypothetical protein